MRTWLTEEELAELTGYTWRRKQEMALSEMRIPFTVNPRGRILVTRSIVDGARPAAKVGPDWSALRGTTA